jgi:acetyl esterase
MPIHPDLQPLLVGDTMDVSTLEAASFRAMIAEFMAPGEPVELVDHVEDRTVGGGVPVRIYRPRGSSSTTEPLGCLLFLHGSGWVIMSVDTHDHEARALCNRAGVVVVSVDYRLAPEHKFPSALDDCWAALRWVVESAGELGVDPARIAVGGDSAGGNLAAVLVRRARDAGGPPIAFQLLVYPVLDARGGHASRIENKDGPGLTNDLMEWFTLQYVRSDADRDDPDVSPLAAASFEALPPAFVLTAEYDPLRDEGADYADKLAVAGVPVTYRMYEGATHGFWQMSRLAPIAQQALDECGDALRAAIGG